MRVNVCEHTVKSAPRESFERCHQGGCEIGRGDGGKIEWKLSEVNTRTVPRGQNELTGEFNMAAGDVIN